MLPNLMTALVLLQFLAVQTEAAVEYTLCGDGRTSSTVSLNSTNQELIIRSPNYGISYYSDQHCSLVLQTGADPLMLSFNFQTFKVENENLCYYDYLCLNGVKFCGDMTWETPLMFILPENSSFTVFFKSDYIENMEGFQIAVAHESAHNKTIQEARSGVGNNMHSLNYTTVTYQPGYLYKDRCPTPPENSPQEYNLTADGQDSSQTIPIMHNFCDQLESHVVNISASGSPVVIRSPNFLTGLYPDNITCRVILKSGEEPLVLSFFYRYFNVENHPECYYDYYCANGVRFCGNWLTGRTFQNILPERSNFTLAFRSDGSVGQFGFDLVVTAEMATINQTVSHIGGTLASDPKYVFYYSVVYEPGMPYTDECSTDQGQSTPPPEQTTLMMTTSGSAMNQETNTVTFCAEGVVNLNSSSPEIYIYSPDYNMGGYSNNQHCSLMFTTNAEPMILFLQFDHMQLEEVSYCSYDYLCVHGVKFCGNWTTTPTLQYIVPEFNSFTMFFRSDISVTTQGFQIRLTHEPAGSQEIQEVRSGDGVSPNSLNFTTVTYQPGYQYTDQCTNSPENDDQNELMASLNANV